MTDPAVNPIAPHHRNVSGGPARAAVFGVQDGLVSNLALILGFAGASSVQGPVRIAGLSGLLAGALSMAAGEWVSMQAQKELLQHELERERIELAHRPELERQELRALYIQRGISAGLADQLATEVARDPKLALQVHAREELGVDPDDLGSPGGAAGASLVTFGVGAFVPLAPWLFGGGIAAMIWSVALSFITALLVGFLLAGFTDRNRWFSALRQALIAMAAAAVTFGVGSALGA